MGSLLPGLMLQIFDGGKPGEEKSKQKQSGEFKVFLKKRLCLRANKPDYRTDEKKNALRDRRPKQG